MDRSFSLYLFQSDITKGSFPKSYNTPSFRGVEETAFIGFLANENLEGSWVAPSKFQHPASI